MPISKRLAIRMDHVASFNSVSEHTTLFEKLHDRAAKVAGAAPSHFLDMHAGGTEAPL